MEKSNFENLKSSRTWFWIFFYFFLTLCCVSQIKGQTLEPCTINEKVQFESKGDYFVFHPKMTCEYQVEEVRFSVVTPTHNDVRIPHRTVGRTYLVHKNSVLGATHLNVAVKFSLSLPCDDKTIKRGYKTFAPICCFKVEGAGL